MFEGVFGIEIVALQGIKFSFLILICLSLISDSKSLVMENNDAKFIAGYKSLFTNDLTTYPESMAYNIAYSVVLTEPSTYYEVVISLNTFELMECNTIGWNLRKMNITNMGFGLIYEAGINSAIYSLAINYMAVDNSYPDFEIAYYDKRCKLLNQGIGYRSENVSYKSQKFSNDSNYASIVVFESFNITNTQYNNIILKNNIHHTNLTLIVQFYTSALSLVHDIQAYIILYNTAYMQNTMQRIVLVFTGSTDSPPLSSSINSASNARFRKRQRFFAGISGLNVTKTSNRSFQLKFYQNQIFDFQLNSSGVNSLDLSFLSTYVASCPALTIYSMADNDCLSACPANQYPDYTHTLPSCKSCHHSCSSCWDFKETSCQACASSTTRNLNVTGTYGSNLWYSCECKAGYFEVNSVNCQSCNNYLPGCAKCSNQETCLECKVGLKLIDDKCVCNSPTSFYSLPDMDCIPRIIGCETHVYDGVNLICTECYVQRNFTLNSSFKCECQQPLLQVIQDVNLTGDYWCNYICGDGFVGDGEPCDDKNTVSGDGCSFACQVENNFVCTNLVNMPSTCLFNSSVQLTFHTGERVMYENTAVLNFTFEPSVNLMNTIKNWSELVVTTIPYSKIEDDFKCPDISNGGRCNLTLTVQYTGELEEEVFEIYLKLSTHTMIKFDSRKLYFTPKGQVSTLTYEPDSHLTMIATVDIIVLVLVVLGLVIFLVSIYIEKMVGIQLITTLQYIYYLMSGIVCNPIQMVPFEKNLKLSTGFNQIYNYTYYRYAPLPVQLNHQFYEKQFLMNVNVMLLVLVFVLLILLVIKIYNTIIERMEEKSLTPKQEQIFQNPEETKRIRQFHRHYKLYWNKLFFSIVFFLLYPVLFGSVITTLTELPTEDMFSPSLNFLAMLVSLFIMVMGVLSVGYWYNRDSKTRGSVSLSENQIIPYEFPICSKTYIMLFTVVQPIKIWIIAIFFQENYCYFITVPSLLGYFIVLVVMRPYKESDGGGSVVSEEENQIVSGKLCISVHNFAICFNQFCLILCNVLYLVWNLKARDDTFMDQYPQLMFYISLILIFLLQVVAILRLFYKQLGAILFCEYFKKHNPNVITFENSFQNMRKVIRQDELKPALNSYQYQPFQTSNQERPFQTLYQHQQQRNPIPQKITQNRTKILQDLKKSKQFVVNWKDDPKPKYSYNEYKNQYKESSSESQGQDSPPRDNTIMVQANITSNPYDISSFMNGKPQSRKSLKNPGVVEMQTLGRADKVIYKVNISSEKKKNNVNELKFDQMIEKKEFEDFINRKNRCSVHVYDAEPESKKGASELEEIKMRMRKEFNMKKSQIKESFLEDQ